MTKKKNPKKKAKRPKKRKAETEPYFVGINNPVELRKHILEPTREVIQFLQSYEDLQEIKKEKTQTIARLKDDLKAIKTEVNKLKRFLPKNKLRIEKITPKIKEEVKKEKRTPPKIASEETTTPKYAPSRAPSELESLEKELGAIEKKLGTLSE